jgi:peptidoglycan/LPS O-acetylase OafA/YrhL
MGLLRLFLALSVIAGHAGTTVFGMSGIGAWNAVNFFFIISGFYMAMVLNAQYKTVSNFQFYKSRVLRLFPAYYIGIALSLAVGYTAIANFFDSLTPLSKLIYVFQNLFIVGQDLSHVFCIVTISGECADPNRLIMNIPAWSLAVELGFYLVAPFILKSKTKTFGFVLAGAVYLLFLRLIEFPFPGASFIRPVELYSFNYFFYPSSFAFFGAGALAYHLSRSESEPNYLYGVVALILLSFAQKNIPLWGVLFFAMAMPVLFKYTAKNKVDRLIGELSYPVYIVHYPILIWLRDVLSGYSLIKDFISLGTLVSLVSIVVGLIIYSLVERKVSRFRHSKSFMSPEESTDKAWQNKIPKMAFLFYMILPVFTVAYLINVQNLPNNTPYDITDDNWNGGVGRHNASFLVTSSKANVATYQTGMRVTLGGSDVREIVSAEASGPYLNVRLNGEILSGEASGFPHKIVIMSN